MKNQFELINLKFQNLTDENFSLKKESLNLEKEARSKNELIESLKSEIIQMNKNNLSNKKNPHDTNSSGSYNDNSFSNMKNKNNMNSDSYLRDRERDREQENNLGRNYTSSQNKSNNFNNNENSAANFRIKSNTIDHDEVLLYN